jgi:hypothetical protein
MWLLLNDAFLSIVHKDCERGEVLVRARRVGDIEKVFGRIAKVTRNTKSDYLYRAVISKDDLKAAIAREVDRITYRNFKDSVSDDKLHGAYIDVWTILSRLQPLSPVLTSKLNFDERPKRRRKNGDGGNK